MVNFEEISFTDDIEIFTNEDDLNLENDKEKEGEQTPEEKKDIKEDITEIETEVTFQEKSEEVGNEDKNKTDGEDDSSRDSPKSIYSSFANALVEDNVLTTISLEDLKELDSSDKFAELIKKEVNNQLEEGQRRIKEALESGVEPQAIQQYESTLNYLNNLSEEVITDESEKATQLRQNLIMQDYLNRGFSEERAKREVKKSFDAGTEIEDAKESLKSNREFFKKEYDNLLEEAKKETEEETKALQKVRTDLQKLVTSNKDPFEGVTLDKATRQKVYDTISKPIHEDKDGNKYTAIQKYEKENKVDFMYKLGVLFELTNGFKDVDKLVKRQVKKETKSSLKDLELTLQGNQLGGGPLSFMGGVNEEDTNSKIGLTLNV